MPIKFKREVHSRTPMGTGGGKTFAAKYEKFKKGLVKKTRVQIGYFQGTEVPNKGTLIWYQTDDEGKYQICVRNGRNFLDLTGEGLKQDDKGRWNGFVGPLEKDEVDPTFEDCIASIENDDAKAEVIDLMKRSKVKPVDGFPEDQDEATPLALVPSEKEAQDETS